MDKNMTKKIDLSQATFITPLKIDSDDRIRNIITVICFLLKTFDTNILVKEVDENQLFKDYALPQITEFLEGDIANLNYIFEKSNDSVFHRMKIINEMISQTNTKIIVNYDCDVLLKPKIYQKSYDMILNDSYDVVYPYGFGNFQKQIFVDDEIATEFLNENFDFNILEKKHQLYPAEYGHVQFFNRESYISAGMENENFVSWSPEDKERFFRFTTLGYNVGRVDDYVYHLEHSRGQNSDYSNPHLQKNMQLWEYLQKLNKQQLTNYYQSQKYLRKYKCYNNI
jgi:hypothetical protein